MTMHELQTNSIFNAVKSQKFLRPRFPSKYVYLDAPINLLLS